MADDTTPKSTENEIKAEDFEGAVDQTFDVAIGDDVCASMTLERAEKYGAENTTRKEAPFSLIFTAPSSCRLQSGVYTVSSEATGTHDMYLALLGDNETVKTFEAHYR